MRHLNDDECGAVSGGFRVVIAAGALIAWAFANRADLVEMGQAAMARDAELDAEH